MALNDYGYKGKQIQSLQQNHYTIVFSAIGIRIDSGDLAYLSRVVRETMERVASKFEMEWFKSMVITASNDINEETILSLNEQGHKITCFGKSKRMILF